MEETEEQQEQVEKKPKRWISKTILGVISLVLILAVLVQATLWGAVAWLNTEGGQGFVNEKIKTALVGTGYEVELSGLSYRPFTTLVIGDLSVKQNGADFVTGKNIYLHTELTPMMAKELIVSLTAEQIIIHKLGKPESEEKPPLQIPRFEAIALPDIHFKTITLSKVSVEDLKIGDGLELSPSLSAKIGLGKKQVSVKLALEDDSGFAVKNLSFDGELASKEMLLSVKALSVVSDGFVVSAKGQYDLKVPAVSLESVVKLLGDGKQEDILAQVSAQNLEQGLGGYFRVETKVGDNAVSLKSGFETDGEKLDLSGLDFKGFGASVTGQGSLDKENIAISGVASVASASIDSFKLDIAHAQTPYQISFKASGTQEGHPVAADLSFEADAVNKAVNALSGSLTLQKSVINISGSAGMEKLDLKADFKGFSLLDLPVDMSALSQDLILDGGFTVTGSPEIPVVISDIKIKPQIKTPDITITAKGGYKDNALNYELAATGQGIRSLNGKVFVPVQLSLMPFKFDMSLETPLDGEVDAHLDVASLAALVLPPDQEISGLLKANGTIKGKMSKPEIDFKADMAGGLYHHKSAGFQLKDINLTAEMVGERVSIKVLTATDGEEGKVKLSGFYDLAAQNFDMAVKAKSLHALKGKIVDGKVDLDVGWSGNMADSLIKGRVDTGKINVTIPERFSQGIPVLNVVKENEKKEKVEPFGENIAVDMIVNAPQQVFVSGWGLDAEFAGKLEIGGTVYKPVVKGGFSSLRGRYEEFGKNFAIERAKINFSGASPPSPELDVLTSTKSGDVKAQINITGDVNKPNLKFSSVPDLPEDEVLSRLLFGKSTEKITPFQAVELARTLQRFSGRGGGGGFNPMGLVKGLTGLDDIRVDSEEGGETTIGAGKYLTDKVYLEFETGTGDSAGGANLEVEVTPDITIESEIGQDAQGGAGIFWNWDY